MMQFKVSYKYREADFGQAKRAWSSNFQIIDADTPDDAKSKFSKKWMSNSEFEIKEVEQCGAQ